MGGFHVLVVDPSPKQAATQAANAVVANLQSSGMDVIGPDAIVAERSAVHAALAAASASPQTDFVIVVGGCGLGPSDVVPEAFNKVSSRMFPGFGEMLRLELFRDIGAEAALNRACAGAVGSAIGFAVPGDEEASHIALHSLILPYLEQYRASLAIGSVAPAPTVDLEGDTTEVIEDAEVEAVEETDELALPEPEQRWRLGGHTVGMEAQPTPVEAPAGMSDQLPASGWKRAVYDMEGQVEIGKSPDVPQNVEDHAPMMEVLYQAGEYARLKLPNGNRVMLYGYPDLQRPNSKVILVGWGEPLAEVIALHRYPVQVGTCIEEARGLMPARTTDLTEISEKITGRALSSDSGELFAVDHDTVYIQRGNTVYSWDGRKERNEGTPKQALTSMMVRWHQR